jgi:2-polyprenyl-3-methyl-5-hydroxy-6-metoxy-1,4-benzoquinol methylase
MDGASADASDDWDDHWDRYGEAARSNPANQYRWTLIRSHLAGPGNLGRIVDVGSGQGELTMRLAAEFPDSQVCGLEYSALGVKRSQEAARSAGLDVEFIQVDLLERGGAPGLPGGWATAAVCSEVLEHVDAPETLLGNALEYMAPGCHVVVTVPAGPRTAFDRHIGHRRHFTPRLLEQVLADAGLQVETIRRAGFPFFNLYKTMVLLRGRKLISDVEHSERQGMAARVSGLVERIFGLLFRWNLRSSPFGWQLVAVARKPG